MTQGKLDEALSAKAGVEEALAEAQVGGQLAASPLAIYMHFEVCIGY